MVLKCCKFSRKNHNKAHRVGVQTHDSLSPSLESHFNFNVKSCGLSCDSNELECSLESSSMSSHASFGVSSCNGSGSERRTPPTPPPPPPPPPPLPPLKPSSVHLPPLPRLKPLHWDKVRLASERSMVWDNIRSRSFEFNEEMMECLFGYNLQSPMMKKHELKSKDASPSKHMIEHKRLQNITILFKALNATTEEVCDALVQGSGLSAEQLELLIKMMPTKDEAESISKCHGNGMSPPEQFIKKILKIPFAFLRIEVMQYREAFEYEVSHLNKTITVLEEACVELRSSGLFLRLLEIVLEAGNRMNAGTMKGGARAFKLDALLKLVDVKGIDGKTTLLHFVIQEATRMESIGTTTSLNASNASQDEHGNVNIMAVELVSRLNAEHGNVNIMAVELVSRLNAELCNVRKAAGVDLDAFASLVSNLVDGMMKTKHLIEEELPMLEESGEFLVSMRSFLSHGEGVIDELKVNEARALLCVRDIREYYHGEMKEDEAMPLRIFVTVKDFLDILDRKYKHAGSLRIHQHSHSS